MWDLAVMYRMGKQQAEWKSLYQYSTTDKVKQ